MPCPPELPAPLGAVLIALVSMQRQPATVTALCVCDRPKILSWGEGGESCFHDQEPGDGQQEVAEMGEEAMVNVQVPGY